MSPQNAISILNKQPTILTFFPELKPCRCLAFPSSQFLFPGKHFPQKIVSFKNRARSPYKMKEPIKTRIYRVRNGDECVMCLEHEAFIDGSSEFRPIVRANNGFESALNRSSKWVVAILFAAAILWRHDADAMWAALGITLNAGLSTTLKKILNQERPLSASRSDPGMPSSHAQSMFFTAMFANFSLVEFLGMNAFTTTMIGLIFALASYLSWLRVSQQFHTTSQVAVGAVVGTIFAILWFWLWNTIVFDAYLSYLWVRIIVVLGAAGYSLAFSLYIMRYWVMESIVNFVNVQINNLS